MAPRIQLSFQGCVHAHFHFFLFLFPRCIITLFIQSFQGFPPRLISLRCSSLAFFPCFPLFALLYLPLDTSVLPLNLTSPYFSSSHPLGASSLTGTPVTLLTLQCKFVFLNYCNFRSNESAKRETGERDSPRRGIKFVSDRVTTVPSTLRKQKEHENQRALLRILRRMDQTNIVQENYLSYLSEPSRG